MNTLQAIQPTVAVKLEADEQVYAEFKAYRAGNVASFKTKGAGVGLGVGVVGVGVGGGESVAGKKFQVVATGQLLLTNKRMLFVGDSLVQIPYNTIHVVNFKKSSQVAKYKWQQLWIKTKGNPFAQYSIPTFRKTLIMTVLYDGGLDNEQYMVTSKNARTLASVYETVTKTAE